MDRLGVSVPIRYFAVPRKATKDVKYYVEEMNVEKVPTFIFSRDGKEIGRIKENPKTGMIEDMLNIVAK
jgi:predicted DsbA family dithiol-disulfide isomerase